MKFNAKPHSSKLKHLIGCMKLKVHSSMKLQTDKWFLHHKRMQTKYIAKPLKNF